MDINMVSVRCLLLLISVFLPTRAFDIFTKMTCQKANLKHDVDSCTPPDGETYFIFLPASLPSHDNAEQTYVSTTGIDYQQVFVQVNHYRCLKEQMRKQIAQMQCRYRKVMRCLPSYYRTFLPDQNRIKEGMRYLCDHRLNNKQGCDENKLSQMNRCVMDKDQGFYTEDEDDTEENKMCRTYSNARECLMTSLSQCQQSAIDRHLKVMDYLRPQFCGAGTHVSSLTAILFFTGLAQIVSNLLFEF